MRTKQSQESSLEAFERFNSAINPKEMSRDLTFLFLDYITSGVESGDDPDPTELQERARNLRHLLWLLHGMEDAKLARPKKSNRN